MSEVKTKKANPKTKQKRVYKPKAQPEKVSVKPKVVAEKEEQDNEKLFVENSDKTVYDVILANLIALTAVALSAFIPVLSLALPFLVFIYFEVGLYGFVLNKETGKSCKYEDLFVSIKKYVKIFCTAIVKIFMILFWSLFLIVPGVVCALNYAFSCLIIKESDELDVKGILMLSKELAIGYRWQMFFYMLLSAASVCVSMTFVFSIILLFDLFLVVPSTIYILLVLMAGLLDFVILAVPMCEIAITDCYILAKQQKLTKSINSSNA